MTTKMLLAGLAVALTSCGGPSGTQTPDKNIEGAPRVVPPDRGAMKLELVAVTTRGQLAVKTDGGDWQTVMPGASVTGVREVRAIRRGAIVTFGHPRGAPREDDDAAGRLWLRAGTTVRLGQDDKGIHVALRSGRARVRRAASGLPLFVDSATGSRALEGDYVLQHRIDDATVMTPTGARPELAEFSLAIDGSEDGSGVGRMVVSSGADDKDEALALRRVSVVVKTSGDLAVTEVEHVFFNPADTNREGTFRFPVPDGAMLTGMAMEINGELVEGEIVEREKARSVYEKIVDEMQDPALLEWEEGNWFKLRVFPIEAGKEKRVVIRYTAPLARGESGWEYGYSLGTPDPALPIGELKISVDGTIVAQEKTVTTGVDLAVPVDTGKVPAVMAESRPDGNYTAVRISAPADLVATRRGPRKIALIVDTSRSALEGKPLQLELAKTALGELSPADSFVVLAADVTVTPHANGFVSVTPASIAKAIAFVDAIEPDGASDLAAALAAAKALAPSDVIYIGDGIPTWGERDAAKLGVFADTLHAPIHAGLIGKGASSEVWSEVAGRTGGRAMIVRRTIDARRFALVAAHANEVGRLDAARLEAIDGAIIYPAHATTLFAGDELVALIRTPTDKPRPAAITLAGFSGGKPVKTTLDVSKPVQVAHVMQRWAAFQLAALESEGAPREDIVKLSQDAGLMSRYTSLLVLENDEAYKLHQIERRRAQQEQLANAAPKITGGDLDSLGAPSASLSPDEIQPGDPEIRIPAPVDARSVIVVFPFGDTKRAEWDADAQAWMVRFLIDKDTADGDYTVRVTITHADGRLEILTLPYSVDTKPPAIELTVTRVTDGYRIRAKQIASRDGSLRKDADRVEIVLPDGTTLTLPQTAWGKFEGVWLTAPLASVTKLRVVVRDRALNQSTSELLLGGR